MRNSARILLTLLPATMLMASAAGGRSAEAFQPAALPSDEFRVTPFPAAPIPAVPLVAAPATVAGGYSAAVNAQSSVQPAAAQLGTSPYSPRTPSLPPATYDNATPPPGAGGYQTPGSRTLSGDEAGRLIQGPYSGNWFDYCGPNARVCYSHLYGSVDAWFMHRNDATWKNIARSNSTGQVLGRSRDPDFNLESVPKLTLGKAFCDWSIEGTAYYKDDIDAHTDAVNTNLAGDVNAVFFGLQGAGSDYFQANRMRINLYDGFHSYEGNLINTVSFVNWMVGVRYVEFRETLDVRAFGQTGNSNADIGTYNRMIGGQVGFRAHYDNGLMGYELGVKTGMYHNDAHIGTVVRDNNNANVIRNLHTGGQNEAFLSELNANVSYRPYLWLSLRAGYQFMYINEIALAPDQILSANNGINSGSIPNAHGDMFMHGPSLGAEFRW